MSPVSTGLHSELPILFLPSFGPVCSLASQPSSPLLSHAEKSSGLTCVRNKHVCPGERSKPPAPCSSGGLVHTEGESASPSLHLAFHVSVLGPARQSTTHWVAQNSRGLLSHNFGGRESETLGLAGLHFPRRLQMGLHFSAPSSRPASSHLPLICLYITFSVCQMALCLSQRDTCDSLQCSPTWATQAALPSRDPYLNHTCKNPFSV